MERQTLIDRLLESENLTDKLDDDAADTLLNWGIAQVDKLIAGTSDEEKAGNKVNDLMGFMRKVNTLAADPSKISADAVADLLHSHAAVFGRSTKADEKEHGEVARAISGLEPKEAVAYLIQRLRSEKA